MKQNPKGSIKHKLAAIAVVSMAAALTGCNNGSSGSSSSEGSAEGVVYDGYLVGALVCVDRNLNKACDENEPSAITGEGGEFEIDGLSNADSQYPLVMESTASTIDEDTFQAVGAGLTFLAPAGSKAVSGFSTIIQSKIEEALAAGSEASLEELKKQAAAELADELGIGNIDLSDYDPIAAKNFSLADNATRETAAKLHLVNQVISQQIITLKPQADANSAGNAKAAFGALVKKLNVAGVKAAVDNDTAGLALADIITATKEQIVTAPTPEVPSAQDILDQADIDDIVDDLIDDLIDDDATGATGATGGTGTA